MISASDAGADIAVRRDGSAGAEAPALAFPDLEKEAANVGDHRRRRSARQHALEVRAGEIVLLLEEEGAGKLQSHTHQLGLVDEDGAQRGNGAFQQHLALGLVLPRLGRTDRRQPGEEQDFGPVAMVAVQGPQEVEREFELFVQHQHPRLHDSGVGREMRVGGSGDRDEDDKREE